MTLQIPNDALNQHIAILGKTGSGKSYSAKGIVERLLSERRQVCVLDPTSAWWGLRLGSDGHRKGFDVVLLGGKHGDIPLAERSGAAVARLVTQQHASCVIDTSGMTVGEYTRWFIDFAGTLYTTIRNPLHLVIDEAHYFMPQGKAPDPQAGRMIHAGNRLMSGGRSLGIRGMLITQRPAKLHKDALTCADTLIAMRVIAPQDRKAIKEWIDGAGDPEQGKQVLDSLAQLQRGEGWVWYPEGGHLERVRFPKIKTYDSSATPKHGERSEVSVSKIDFDEVRTAMADAVREAEANDPKLLRQKIAELETQLRGRPTETKIQTKEVRVEVPVLKNGQLDKALAVLDKLASITGPLSEAIGRAAKPAPQISPPRRPAIQPKLSTNGPMRPVRPVREKSSPSPQTTDGDFRPNKTQQRILDALAWYESLGDRAPTLTKVGAVALIDTSGGHFSNTVGPLSSAGLVERGTGTLSLSDAGRAIAEQPESVGTLDEYHELLRNRVRKMKSAGGKTVDILNVIIESGGSLTTEKIGQAVGLDHTGGYFSNCIGPLSTAGLIKRQAGQVTPTEVLFPPGL